MLNLTTNMIYSKKWQPEIIDEVLRTWFLKTLFCKFCCLEFTVVDIFVKMVLLVRFCAKSKAGAEIILFKVWPSFTKLWEQKHEYYLFHSLKEEKRLRYFLSKLQLCSVTLSLRVILLIQLRSEVTQVQYIIHFERKSTRLDQNMSPHGSSARQDHF